MIVVSDASPISALIRIDELKLLSPLFKTIIIPPRVHKELLALRDFGFSLYELEYSDWIFVKTPHDSELIRNLRQTLDAGEAEAIALAEELKANYLLIDEKNGREVATKRGLQVVGILGVLLKAKQAGLIPKITGVLERLKSEARVWIDKNLEERILKEAGEA